MQTGIVTDPAYLRHITGQGHPESPARLESIAKALKNVGLQTPKNVITSRLASEAEILLCHTKEYFHLVDEETKRGSTILSTGDVTICPESFTIARLAVGGVLCALDAVFEGTVKNAFCAVRPPGHHACPARGMGFCLFNNVAIGARYAQTKYGIDKIVIIDWDVHHGNGTEEIFEEDPSVFYFSTHQEGIYPGTGSASYQGKGKGVGTTLNCPIFPGKEARSEVVRAFKDKLVPKMETFQPELVLISAGFDAHFRDPLGSFNLTDEDFAQLTTITIEIAKKYAMGKLISVLEGGYDLEGLATASVHHVAKLAEEGN